MWPNAVVLANAPCAREKPVCAVEGRRALPKSVGRGWRVALCPPVPAPLPSGGSVCRRERGIEASDSHRGSVLFLLSILSALLPIF